MAVGSSGELLLENLRQTSKISSSSLPIFDIDSFFSNVILPDIVTSSSSSSATTATPTTSSSSSLNIGLNYLRGRALWCAAQFTDIRPSQERELLLRATTSLLHDPEETLAIKFVACKVISLFCSDPILLCPFLSSVLEGLYLLLVSSTEETIVLLLDALLESLKVSPVIATQHCTSVLEHLMTCWSNFYTDPEVSISISNIVQTLATVKKCLPLLQNTLLPRLIPLLSPSQAAVGSSLLILSTSSSSSSSFSPLLFLCILPSPHFPVFPPSSDILSFLLTSLSLF
jgi:hypothetical protein